METLLTLGKAGLSEGRQEKRARKVPLYLVMGLIGLSSVTLGQEDVISAGHEFAVVICRDGTARAAGENEYGQLGCGLNDPYRPTPTQVIQSTGVPLSNIKAVNAGGFHTLFLLEDGTVRAVGGNNSGQLGDGTNTDRYVPVQVLGPPPNNSPLTNIVAVSAGRRHSLFLDADSTVWAVGNNECGKLGDPGIVGPQNRAIKVKGPDGVQPLRNVIAIAAGENHSLFLTKDGRVWAVGCNSSGQLGDGTTQNRRTVVPVVKADGSPFDSVIAIAAGEDFSLFLRQDGSVWAVGDNMNGQLGDGTTQDRLTPVQVKMRNGGFLTNVAAIAAGGIQGAPNIVVGPSRRYSLFLRRDGTVWGVGANAVGQLAAGNIGGMQTLAVQVLRSDSTPLTNVVAIAASAYDSYFVRSDGTVFASGFNFRGQHGNGTTTSTRFATQTNFCQARVNAPSYFPFRNPSLIATLYPNPTSGLFTVHLSGYNEEVEIRILDLVGREVQRLRGEGPSIPVNLVGRPGVYLVEVRTRAGAALPVKVVVME